MSDSGQQHPLNIYYAVWILLFVISAFSYAVDYYQLQGTLRWTLILIFMFLKNVGGRGVSMPIIKLLVKKFPKNKCTIAGGIKTKNQIRCMRNIGVQSVIVSTLIHINILGTINGP